MAKYHIASDGMAKPCKATVKACPLGDGGVHGDFDTPEAAQRWAENKLAVETMGKQQYEARIARRVSSALDGRDEHWNVVPGREVSDTAEALVARVDATTYPAVLKTFQSMVRKDRGRDVFAQINKLGEAAVKFNPAATFDIASLRMAAASVPVRK